MEQQIIKTAEIHKSHFDIHILVTGNGFDIEHGYDTRYKDFVNYTKELDDCTNPFIVYFQDKMDASAEKEELKWIDCEQEIAQIVDSFSKITRLIETKPDGYLCDAEAKIYPRDRYVYSHFPDYYVVDDNGVSVNSKYRNNMIGVYEKQKIIDDLLSDFEEATELLKQFIREAMKANVFRAFQDIHFDYVINFNYTLTYRKYGLEDDVAYNIHGSAGHKINNLVFGISDEDLSDSDYLYFTKRNQYIRKNTPRFNITEIRKSKHGHGIPVRIAAHFYGHSMGNIDGIILKEIIENVDRSYVYFYDEHDREDKINNIVGLFGSEKTDKFIREKRIMLLHKNELEENAK